MNRRALVLLLICFVLAAATVTLRYIESEKEKIKAQFVPPPRIEQKSAPGITTTAYPVPEQPAGEEGVSAGEQPDTVPPQQDGSALAEGERDVLQDGLLKRGEPPSQGAGQDEPPEVLPPPIREERGIGESEIAVGEEEAAPPEMEVPEPPESGERLAEGEVNAETEEVIADGGGTPDGEREKEVDPDEGGRVSPETGSEMSGARDEQLIPEAAEGEVETGEGGYVEVEPFEEVLDGQEEEMAGEEYPPLEEGEFFPDEEGASGADEEEGYYEEEEW